MMRKRKSSWNWVPWLALVALLILGAVRATYFPDVITKKPWADVRAFGADPTGASDSATAVRDAVDSLSATCGGTVYFPPGVYRFDSEVVVSVSGTTLLGHNRDGNYYQTTGSYIKPGANISGSLIRIAAQADTKATQGVSIIGLSFRDDYGGPASDQGRQYTIEAAIHLEYTHVPFIRDCDFDTLKGRAIWTEYCIRGRIDNIDVDRCGDTDKPSIDINEYDATHHSSIWFSNASIEVGYLASYLNIHSSASGFFENVQFEAEATVPDTEQQFITCAGSGNWFKSISLGSNEGAIVRMLVSGSKNAVHQLNVSGESPGGRALDVTGFYNQLHGVRITCDAQAEEHYAVQMTKSYNELNGVYIQNYGGIQITGTAIANTISNYTHYSGSLCTIEDSGAQNSFLNIRSDESAGTGVCIDLNGDDAELIGGHIRESSTIQKSVQVAGGKCVVQGVKIISMTHASHEGIDVDGNYNLISGNHFSGAGTPITDAGAGTKIENNWGADETVTAASPALQHWGYTEIDSSGNAVNATLGSGKYVGQTKTIVMTDATNSSTVSVTNHETSDPEVGTFDAVDEVWVLIWTGTEWADLKYSVGVI